MSHDQQLRGAYEYKSSTELRKMRGGRHLESRSFTKLIYMALILALGANGTAYRTTAVGLLRW